MRYITLSLLFSLWLFSQSGEEVFKTYCWGCHHQSATAFGPSFQEIANKRTKEEIRGMISDPEGVSKILGYSRNAMPKLNISDKNLTAITNYILSFKSKGKK
jgi:cytochrome c551/c552